MRSLALAVLLACHSAPPVEPKSEPKPAGDDDPTCPLVVEGTSISAEDVDGGVAFVFVTTGDVAAVRTRAQALADAHEKHSCTSCMAAAIEIASKPTVAELPNGAKVVFAATNPDDVANLQSSARMHAGHPAHSHGTCKMMM